MDMVAEFEAAKCQAVVPPLLAGEIATGDARQHMTRIATHSVDLSFWSPPYYVGKAYEQYLDFTGWQNLLKEVVAEHARVLRPGGFMVVNIGDILCFEDPEMPRFQADNVRNKKSPVTREDVLCAKESSRLMLCRV